MQDVREFKSQEINRDLWSTQSARDIINEHFTLCQYDKDSAAGRLFLQFYPCSQLPVVCFLCPLTKGLLLQWNGPFTPEHFEIIVSDFLKSHTFPLLASKLKRTSSEISDADAFDEPALKKKTNLSTLRLTDSPVGLDTPISQSVVPIFQVNHQVSFENRKKRSHSTLDQEEILEHLCEPDVCLYECFVFIQSGPEVTRVKFLFGNRPAIIRRFLKSDSTNVLYKHAHSFFGNKSALQLFTTAPKKLIPRSKVYQLSLISFISDTNNSRFGLIKRIRSHFINRRRIEPI